MDDETRQFVNKTAKSMAQEFEAFLKEKDPEKRWKIGRALERIADEALERTEGKHPQTESFGKFVDVLYGCQQIDDFGSAWGPNEGKMKVWIEFLKKFSV